MAEFDRFSPSAQRALQLARAAAERMNHDSIGTEHLLLGIVEEREDLAVYLLNLLGVRLKSVLDEIRATVGETPEPFIGRLTLTDHARTALQTAVEERRRMGQPKAGTVHLLLGLLEMPNCLAVKVLERLQVDVDELSASLRSMYVSNGDRLPVGPVLERVRDARLEHGDLDQAPGHVEVNSDALAGRARLITQLARDAALEFRHDTVGTDHLLLGLISDRDGGAARVLRSLGMTEKRVALAVLFARGLRRIGLPPPGGQRPLSPRAQNALALAGFIAPRGERRPGVGMSLRVAGRIWKSRPIDSTYLLIGLLDGGRNAATTILESFELDLDVVRARALAHIRRRAPLRGAPPQAPESLWEWINQQLIRRQWSLADLERHAGIQRHRVQLWMRGQRRPTGDSCDALAAAFGADPNSVRRLAGRPLIAQPPVATPGSLGALRALFEQVTWDEGRIERMTALLHTMLSNDREHQRSDLEQA